ncbi:hypothetical protein FLM9_1310 [Candidatus Synechococcus spongiarum]|uniref:Uncharacterized protein n=1 Tax=Candidatus Synechococcus spongiarum TaxID=431041 RepID=A0A164ZSA2_9SYNE|nr:hypothetical protein FLM9_1310 [Candidatus Synechococcus spongiarum]
MGRAVSTALDFSRTVNALPVGLAWCLGSGCTGPDLSDPTAVFF